MNRIKYVFFIVICVAFLAGCHSLFNPPKTPNVREQQNTPAHNADHNIAPSPYFMQLDFYNMQSNDHLTLLPKFKTRQQTTGYTCGPAAALMVVEYLNGASLHSEMEIAKIMGTSNYSGTDVKGILRYFQKLGWQIHSSADTESPSNYAAFIDFIKNNLKNNTPILVENVEWGGHWRAIIGYDTMNTPYTGDDVLIMADPFDTADHLQDGYNIVPAEKFFYMWFDAQLFNSNERQRPWVTAVPK